jgi:hypothetical protein
MNLLASISYTWKADIGTKQRPFFLISSLLSYALSSLIAVSIVVFAPLFTSLPPVLFRCKIQGMYVYQSVIIIFKNKISPLCALEVKRY